MNDYLMKRKNRRKKVSSIISALEQIHALERNYCLSIPDSPANEDRQLESDYTVDILGEVIDSLRDLF